MIDSLELMEKMSMVIDGLHCFTAASSIRAYLNTGSDEDAAKASDELDLLIKSLERNGGQFYEFPTATGLYNLKKKWIESYTSGIDDNGAPIIKINEVEDEQASYKNNPVRNLVLIFREEEVRDREYDNLKIMLR